ncbi:MAG: Asp23/Gls24 family envelope stress response protein [Clostridium sp.]|nr:Asp23/Gls24 family envelope stress response protein [Clostridium sp.]MCM1547356.1 Asp23/Gls24 family envelope stress response protein [Ruminococcus sp.]
MTVNEQKGTLCISKEALTEIAAAAVCETERAVCGKKDVDVKYAGGVAEIGLALRFQKGIKAYACSEAVQNAVKDSIQSMTGITVSRVNVKICGQI